ncbi:MAG: hypothetical protein ACKVQQ_08010 [Burkholderiales bacterium]
MLKPSILLSIIDGVAEVTLNRPAKLNSITACMHPQPAREARPQGQAADAHDYRNGMAVFLGIRQPDFQGR